MTDMFVERRRLLEAEAEIDRLRDALTRIAKGEGAFSRDPLTHAANTIDNLLGIAEDALDGICPTCHGQGCGDCLDEDAGEDR